MEDANYLLFEKVFGDTTLFKNQLDLVSQLLSNKDTGYYVPENDGEKYFKAQNRLKAYLSQLLSSNVTRNITEDFKQGLKIILSSRFLDSGDKIEEIVDTVIRSLRDKNLPLIKSETKNDVAEQFYHDISAANYIVIITSKPLEFDSNETQISLRSYLFHDLIECLENSNRDLQYLRFNFPLDSYCFLFWKGLRKILLNYLIKRLRPSSILPFHPFLTTLYSKFAIKTETFSKLEGKSQFHNEDLDEVVDEILTLLNRNRYIMVFEVNAPIYSMPLIAINPTQPKVCKIYSLLEDENSDFERVYKYPNNNVLLWRVFVWDKLKSKKYSGMDIKYSKDL